MTGDFQSAPRRHCGITTMAGNRSGYFRTAKASPTSDCTIPSSPRSSEPCRNKTIGHVPSEFQSAGTETTYRYETPFEVTVRLKNCAADDELINMGVNNTTQNRSNIE